MICCPNCGFKHSGRGYADEIDGIRLPRMEYDVILRLRQAAGAIVSNAQLCDFIYGDRPDGGPERANQDIQTHISKARKKIAKVGWIVTNERFRGYRLLRAGR